jgi:antitoxin component of RelBE/YafQ-DinJ toxin-antitoxin module
MKADSNIHIRISEELKEAFTELCKNNKQTTSSVIKRFIREYVRKGGKIRYE